MSGNSTIVRYTLEQIEASIARGEDQSRDDAPEGESMGEAFWRGAIVAPPLTNSPASLRLDKDVASWFEKNVKNQQAKMNSILRDYVEAQRKAS